MVLGAPTDVQYMMKSGEERESDREMSSEGSNWTHHMATRVCNFAESHNLLLRDFKMRTLFCPLAIHNVRYKGEERAHLEWRNVHHFTTMQPHRYLEPPHGRTKVVLLLLCRLVGVSNRESGAHDGAGIVDGEWRDLMKSVLVHKRKIKRPTRMHCSFFSTQCAHFCRRPDG